MKAFKIIGGVLGMCRRAGLGPASAEDKLKIAIGQINNWENQAPTLGQDAGIFKKHGLVLENIGTQGAGETIQAVISGSRRHRRRCRRRRRDARIVSKGPHSASWRRSSPAPVTLTGTSKRTPSSRT